MSGSLALSEVRRRLTKFAHDFKDAANEQQQASIFLTRFYECYGIKAESATIYEQRVKTLSGGVGRIDSFIPGLLIVEHKSKGRDLDLAYEQATNYFIALPEAQRPKYIVVSDFERIRLHDLAHKRSVECTLKQLPSKASWFKFLLEGSEAEIAEEQPINRKAAYAVSALHEALLQANFKGRDLEVFLTRLLFCLFADDTGIFGDNQMFRKLVERSSVDGSDLGARLTELFEVFNTPEVDRQRMLAEDLAAFPYINGQLFADRTRIPAFNSELRTRLLECAVLDWSAISPAIFGAMFQGVLEAHEPDEKRQSTRRELGAHYTSERNILRVINPLFMDDLRAEFEAARRNKTRLRALYDKLPLLKLLDPACGCGNFLVIAYRELRRLEIDVVVELFDFERKGMGLLDVSQVCRVNVDQFYGIEIDEAAVHIARVALYITDHQLNLEAAQRLGSTRASVPLVHTPNIVCANAVRLDWNSVLPASECSYIISNPPFVGKKFQTDEQKADLKSVAGTLGGVGLLDYVACWYLVAAKYIQSTGIEVAFVSTNSITQGEQVAALWGPLSAAGVKVNFAHRTFRWSNDGKGVAGVHCVIVGFAIRERSQKIIFDYGADVAGEPIRIQAKNINPYLLDSHQILLVNRGAPISAVPPLCYGSFALDAGHYTLTSLERSALIQRAAIQGSVIRRFVGAQELLHNEERYVIWLKDVAPNLLRQMPDILERIDKVRAWRLARGRATTVALAATPALFAEIRQPRSDYFAIPTVSSERRLYVPIAMLDASVIASNQIYVLAGAGLYHFGVLQSCMHNAWLRVVGGKLESRYRYSAGIVYNNFVWASDVSDVRRAAVEQTAQTILDVRAKYPDSTLADLYDPLRMPVDLMKAHQANDKAVDKAYGYKGGSDDASRAAFLFKLYEQATSLLPSEKPAAKSRVRKGKAV
jgi:type I restriction-modification system DNA methylase subunit